MSWFDAVLALIGRVGASIGIDDLRITRADVRRGGVLLAAACFVALCVVDFSRAPSDDLAEGDVAPHTVTAPFTFSYTDHERYEAARDEARRSTPPVFVHQADLVDQRSERVLAAFTAGRSTLDAASGENSTDSVSAAVTAFQRELPVQVSADDARKLALAGFSPGAERLTRDLLDRSMRDRLVLLSRPMARSM